MIEMRDDNGQWSQVSEPSPTDVSQKLNNLQRRRRSCWLVAANTTFPLGIRESARLEANEISDEISALIEY